MDPHTNAGWDTHAPEVDIWMEEEKEQMPNPLYRDLYKVEENSRLNINAVNWSGMGPMEQVADMGGALEDAALQGYSYVFNKVTFRKKAVFADSFFTNDESGQAETIARDIASRPEYTRELRLAGLFRNLFAANVTYGDSKPGVSTAHPRKDGSGTQSNTFADGVQDAISYDEVNNLQDVLDDILSNTGNLMSLGDTGNNLLLWSGRKLREKTYQIAGVKGPEFQPNTADNNVNYIKKGENYDVLCSQWFGYKAAYQNGDTTVAQSASGNYWDTLWGIADVKAMKKHLRCYVEPGRPYFKEEVNLDNEALTKFAYDRYAFGMTDWTWVVASKGDGTTYTG